MKRSHFRSAAIARLLVFAWFATAGLSLMEGATVNLFPSADTAMFENAPDNNLGAQDFMPIGRTFVPNLARGLIRFDLSSIPSNASISSVSLRITSVFGGGGGMTPYGLHQMFTAWTEGGGVGGPDRVSGVGALAVMGEATWNAPKHLSGSWGSPGAAPGADYVTTASASVTLVALGNYTFSSAALVTDVQRWLTNNASNLGWLIKDQNESADGSARRIASRESATASERPLLTVTYTVPALAITNVSPLRFGTVAAVYASTFGAAGGVPPYAWSIIGGALPGGLALNSAGVLSGTPAAAGDFTFTVRVADSLTTSTSKVFSITIDPALAFTRSALNAPGVELQFGARTGRTYAVEFRGRVDTGSWNILTNIVVTTNQAAVAQDFLSQTQRFYRVRKD